MVVLPDSTGSVIKRHFVVEGRKGLLRFERCVLTGRAASTAAKSTGPLGNAGKGWFQKS